MRRVRRLTTAVVAMLAVLAGGLLVSAAPALAAPPAVEGESAPSVTPFEAHLEAAVNAAEESAECHFQYGETSVSEHEVACEQGTPPGILEGGEQGVSANATGLKAETSYRYRVLVKNATGKAEGVEEAFTTPALEKPTVENEEASSGSTSATLSAQIDPDYQTTTYSFEYATDEALAGAIKINGSASLNGPGGQTAGVSTDTLEAGKSYFYRILTKNATGVTDGAVKSFTTPPTPFTDPPEVTSGIGGRFEGHFTLIPVDTTYSFEYNVGGGACTGESATPTADGGSGAGSITVSWEVPNEAPPLRPNTQYTVCLVTSNAYGSQVGPPEHFATPSEPPAIDGESAKPYGAGELLLEAKINPEVQETTYVFEYATSEELLTKGEGIKVPGGGPLEPELSELSVQVTISAPQSNTTYYYRVVAENESTLKEGDPAVGEVKLFALPTISTGAASAVGQTSANVTGTVNPEGVETYYYYQYGTSIEYGESTATEGAGIDAGAGLSPAAAPATLVPLVPDTTYHYRLVAWNEDGASYGQDETFTSEAGHGPLAFTGQASGIGVNAATLSGTVNPQGDETSYRFEYGTSTGYGSEAFGTVLAEQGEQPVTLSLRGLEAGTTYHYRLVVSSPGGTLAGVDETFTTPPISDPLVNPTTPPLIASPNIAFPQPQRASVTTTKALTRAQKLKKALKACRNDKRRVKRARCEVKARELYGPVKGADRKGKE